MSNMSLRYPNASLVLPLPSNSKARLHMTDQQHPFDMILCIRRLCSYEQSERLGYEALRIAAITVERLKLVSKAYNWRSLCSHTSGQDSSSSRLVRSPHDV